MSVLGGHGLQHEGAPHNTLGRRLGNVTVTGRALCRCGWLSDVLASDNARKRAHRRHKDTITTRLSDVFCIRGQTGAPWHIWNGKGLDRTLCGSPTSAMLRDTRHPTCWPCIDAWLSS